TMIAVASANSFKRKSNDVFNQNDDLERQRPLWRRTGREKEGRQAASRRCLLTHHWNLGSAEASARREDRAPALRGRTPRHRSRAEGRGHHQHADEARSVPT